MVMDPSILYHILNSYVSDPEPLYTLRTRLRDIQALASVNKATMCLARTLIYPELIKKHVRPQFSVTHESFFKYELVDMAFMTDDQIWSLEFMLCGERLYTPTGNVSIDRILSITKIMKSIQFKHVMPLKLELKALAKIVLTPSEVKSTYKLKQHHITQLLTLGCRQKCVQRSRWGFPKVACDELALRVHGGQAAIDRLHRKTDARRLQILHTRRIKASRMDTIKAEFKPHPLSCLPPTAAPVAVSEVLACNSDIHNVIMRYVHLGRQNDFDHAVVILQRHRKVVEERDRLLCEVIDPENIPDLLYSDVYQYVHGGKTLQDVRLVYRRWLILLSNLELWAPSWIAYCGDAGHDAFKAVVRHTWVSAMMHAFIHRDEIDRIKASFIAIEVNFKFFLTKRPSIPYDSWARHCTQRAVYEHQVTQLALINFVTA